MNLGFKAVSGKDEVGDQKTAGTLDSSDHAQHTGYSRGLQALEIQY